MNAFCDSLNVFATIYIGPNSGPPAYAQSSQAANGTVSTSIGFSTVFNVNAGDYLVMASNVGSAAFRYLGYVFEYIQESSNTIVSTTNTSNVTITPTTQTYKYWRCYPTNDSSFQSWPVSQTNLGVANA